MDDNIQETVRQISHVHLSNDINTEGEDGPSDQHKFNQLVLKAKTLVGEGHIEDAVRLNKKAIKLCYSEKLAKKIRKMEEYLRVHADDSDSGDDNGMEHLGKGFYLYMDLYQKLYAHQQEGVLWLWSLFRRKKGGILGDDMGLGKTIQVISFLSGMFDMQKIHSVLIVLPVAVMVNWEKEFQKWAPGLKVVAYHGNSKREKERALARVQRRGGICLTTYGLVVTSWEQLGGQKDGREFTWDYMVLDEGHKIKNPTKTSKGVHAIPAHNRIILTGTPVQNNLKELWALFDFVHQGSLLGTQRTFKMEYDNPITRAREKDATIGEKKLGIEMAESLKKIISPYFLRRTKAEVKRGENKENENPDGMKKKHAIMPTMTRKNDLIVWTFLTETQLKIYGDFLSLDSVKELLMTSKSPLVALTVLKKICDHPRLLSTRACAQLGIDGDEGIDDDLLETEAGDLSAVTRIQHVADNILINESGKLIFLVNLLDRLKVEGHRCLVFSQSRKMLDIMEKVITNKGHKIMRLDGTISQVQEREQRIQKFQTDSSYSVFLLTTQVGGVGLTLTAADRVVIFDPSWNPATDAQAVDRVFRIGQDKNVVIYRLITCGSVEEKIYRRQIFKDSITRQTTGNAKNPYRYFSKYELKELFTLDDPHTSTTQQALEQMHSGQRLTDPSLDEHIAFLYSLDMFGLSDHDLMFSQGTEGGDDQDESEPSPENDYIQHRVQKARELIQMESSQTATLEERLGKVPGQTTSGAGSGPNRNQFNNWDFPRPELREDYQPVQEELPEVDLPVQGSPERPVRPEAIDLTSPDTPVDCKPSIKDESMTGEVNKTPKRDPSITMEEILISPDARQPLIQTQERNDTLLNDESMTGEVNKTPKRDPSITMEEILISPDARQPLIQTQERNDTLLNVGNLSSLQRNFKPKFNSTIFGAVDSPDNVSQSKSSIHSNGSSPGCLVQDTPDNAASKSRSRLNLIVEDSPNSSVAIDTSHSNRSSENMVDCVEDSVIIYDNEECDETENDNVGNISVHEIKNILQRSLCQNAEEMNNSLPALDADSPFLPRSRRKSTAFKRRVIDSSDEDDGNNEDEVLNISADDDGDNEDEMLNKSADNGAKEEMNCADNAGQNFSINGGNADDGDDDIQSETKDNLKEREMLQKSTEYSEEMKVLNTSTNVQNVERRKETDGVTEEIQSDTEEGADYGDDTGEETEGESDEEETTEFYCLPDEEQIRYNELVESGRYYCQMKQYEEGQAHVLQALEIFPDPELQATAMTIQRKIIKQQMRAQREKEMAATAMK